LFKPPDPEQGFGETRACDIGSGGFGGQIREHVECGLGIAEYPHVVDRKPFDDLSPRAVRQRRPTQNGVRKVTHRVRRTGASSVSLARHDLLE
jgi:hypothetical protein